MNCEWCGCCIAEKKVGSDNVCISCYEDEKSIRKGENEKDDSISFWESENQ